MGGAQKVTINRTSMIFQLAKGDAEKAFQLSSLSDAELALRLSNQNPTDFKQELENTNNSFWGNLIKPFTPNAKVDSTTPIFQFNQQPQDNFFGEGLVVERTGTKPPSLVQYSAKTNATSEVKAAAPVQSQPATKQENAPVKTATPTPAPATYEDAKELTIEAIKKNVINSLEAFLAQKNTQGGVSRKYDSLKELFNTELAGTNVYRVLLADKLGSELMERANKGELSKKEYYEAKIDLVMQLIPNKDKLSKEDADKISQQLHGKSIEDINLLIDSLKYAENNEDAQKILKQEMSKGANAEGNGKTSQVKPNYSDEKISFEEVFELERGVKFDPKKIEEYEQKSAQLALVTTVSNKKDELHKILDHYTNLVEGNNNLGVPKEVSDASNMQLEAALITGLQKLYGDDEKKINEELKKLYGNDTISYEKATSEYGKEYYRINFGAADGIKSYALVDMSKKLLATVDENCKKVLGGKSVEEYTKEYASAYEQAYGRKNATQLARAYASDQESAVNKAKIGLAYGGGLVAAGGMLIPGPGWATAVTITGMLTSTVGGSAVEVANETTRPQGMSDEKWAEIKKELAENVALFAAGFGAGMAGNAVKTGILTGNAAAAATKIAAIAAEIGTDATISLTSQMVLTGQVNLTQEGIAQIMSQLMGIAAAKTAMKRQAKAALKEGAEEFEVGTRSNKKTPIDSFKENLKTSKLKKLANLSPEELKNALNELYPNPKAMLDDTELLQSLGITLNETQKNALKKVIASDNIHVTLELLQNKNLDWLTTLETLKNVKNNPKIVDKIQELASNEKFQNNSILQELPELLAKYPDQWNNITEMATKIVSLKQSVGSSGKVIEYVLKNPDSKSDFYKLLNNKKISCLMNEKGEYVNDFANILEMAKKHPELKSQIIEMASRSNRYGGDIATILNNMGSFENPEELLKIAQNTNLKVNAENKANPMADFKAIFELKNKNPNFSKEIIDLASNKLLKLQDVETLTNIIKNNPESKSDIINLSNIKGYDLETIKRVLKDFEKYPEMRDIIFDPSKTTPNFIDKNPASEAVLAQRKQTVDNITSTANKKRIEELKNMLGADFYNLKWEEIIPKNASQKEINKIIKDLTNRCAMFTRIKYIENKYGKNGIWASQNREIVEKSAVRMQNGDSAREIIDNIAEDLKSDVKANNREDEYSGDNEKIGAIRTGKEDINDQPKTLYNPDVYGEYAEKFSKVNNKKRVSPYDDMELTTVKKIDDKSGVMVHPTGKSVEAGLKHIEDRYAELQPYINKVKNGEKLTAEDLKVIKDKIAEIHYIFANIMPYKRGSAGAADIFTRSIYESLGMEAPPLKKGIGLDLEAFHLSLDDYKKQWDSFFEYPPKVSEDFSPTANKTMNQSTATKNHEQELKTMGLEDLAIPEYRIGNFLKVAKDYPDQLEITCKDKTNTAQEYKVTMNSDDTVTLTPINKNGNASAQSPQTISIYALQYSYDLTALKKIKLPEEGINAEILNDYADCHKIGLSKRTNGEQTLEISIKNIDKENKTVTIEQVKKSADGTQVSQTKTVSYDEFISEYNSKIARKERSSDSAGKTIASLESKLQSQLMETSPEDINNAIAQIKKQFPDATEKEILDVMQKATQFGNFESLNSMSSQLKAMGFGNFYSNSGLTTNTSFEYFRTSKKSINLDATGNKTAFILDDAGLKYLEDLKISNPSEFKQLINNPNIGFVTLSGFNKGINIYNQHLDIASVSAEILGKAKSIQQNNPKLSLNEAVDKAMNEPTLDRASALGINKVTTLENTTKQNIPNSSAKIAEQLAPMKISDKEMNAVIDGIVESYYPNDKIKAEKAKKLLVEYFNTQIDVYSPKRFTKELQNVHNLVKESVIKSGKTENDVYYIVPPGGGSFKQVAMQYQIANNISPERFIISKDGMPPANMPENATFVVLDDIVGSGNSITWDGFSYDKTQQMLKPNQNILFAPIMASQSGIDNINLIIQAKNGGSLVDPASHGMTDRSGKDFVIVNPNQIKNDMSELDFYKNLSFDDKLMLNKLIGSSGYGSQGLCTVFPYMGPDNNSSISTFLLKYFVSEPSALTSYCNFEKLNCFDIDFKAIMENIQKKLAEANTSD